MSKARVVATIGAFDGVHRGHQQLLGQVVGRAGWLGLQSLGVTFDPHPDIVLYPERRLTYLTDRDEKQRILKALGLDQVLVFNFTRELSMLRPEEFLGLVWERHALAELWVGSDFALGRGRSGTIAALAEIGRVEGFGLHVVPPTKVDHEIISSTLIRNLLAQGEVAQANRLLGRAYRMTGVVEAGAARGHQLGFPTANVRLAPHRTLPADGVYVACAEVNGETYRAVVNLGPRPTFAEDERVLEVHLLDFSGDLYNRALSVDFVNRIRDVKRFGSVDELKAQIDRDIADARDRTL